MAYAIATGMVIVSCALSAMSEARDISWRLGTPHNLWEPAMWDATSGIVIIALLPLAQLAAALIRASTGRRVGLALAGLVCLVLVYAALHIVGMGLLREFVYRLGGWPYSFPWASQFPYELRKDLLGFSGLVYAVAATVLGVGFLVSVWRVAMDRQDETGVSLTNDTPARAAFKYSIAYLFILFAALAIDQFVYRIV